MLGACVAGYFVYHAVQGDRGIVAWMQLNQQIRVAETELSKTDTERQEMEQRVALLSNTSLDLDMLEEIGKYLLQRGSVPRITSERAAKLVRKNFTVCHDISLVSLRSTLA